MPLNRPLKRNWAQALALFWLLGMITWVLAQTPGQAPAAGETDIALNNGQKVLALFNQYGVRNFWVLSSGGHEWPNWRRYLYQTAQTMFPDCAGQ